MDIHNAHYLAINLNVYNPINCHGVFIDECENYTYVWLLMYNGTRMPFNLFELLEITGLRQDIETILI